MNIFEFMAGHPLMTGFLAAIAFLITAMVCETAMAFARKGD